MLSFGEVPLYPLVDLTSDPLWRPFIPLFSKLGAYSIRDKIYPRSFLMNVHAEQWLYMGRSRDDSNPKDQLYLLGLVTPIAKDTIKRENFHLLMFHYLTVIDGYAEAIPALYAIPDLEKISISEHGIIHLYHSLSEFGKKPKSPYTKWSR